MLRPAPDVDPPSGLAATEQELPWSASLPLGLSADSALLPRHKGLSAILWEIISSNAWWNVCVWNDIGLSAASQGMLPNK